MSTSAGAYTYSMASNYNRVPKSKVVGISGSEVIELVKRRLLKTQLVKMFRLLQSLFQ
ncbi:MAG: hypothetical protein CM15mP96_3490 [Gammaproteobacteria bacterium]|nr:MAG: hypothetical protein CM15mP96_3490 [Gammaproteobacteria bacterium]